jgi:hypothetical protein
MDITAIVSVTVLLQAMQKTYRINGRLDLMPHHPGIFLSF